ncbi:hypothetical protein CYY_007691 [Polysphondylium violaceum]|uniref:Aladin seven-bladed propeller domain-containing protein n=1 Tax=Polysphondylium violaceum TaxID=133409 RepID=A0A8J4UQQ3_9MYCE|nr:hypothetical protein CYY_007691 [Polysphondylium violaceum]
MIQESHVFEQFVHTVPDQTVYGEYKSKLESAQDESKLPYDLQLERKNLIDLKILEEEPRRGESVLRTPNPTWIQVLQSNVYSTIDSINQAFTKKPVDAYNVESLANKKIKHMAWHPEQRVLAVCNKNDIIYVYYFPHDDMYGMNQVRPLSLWFELQTNVQDLQWKPFHPYILAVASDNGVILWEIDINDLKMSVKNISTSTSMPMASTGVHHQGYNQSKTNSSILNYPYFRPTTITWSSNGMLLACGSPTFSSILMWDVASRVPSFVPRHGGNSFLCWSKTTDNLLSCSAASSGNKNNSNSNFRIWNISNWSYNNQEWKVPSSYQTGAWSDKGDFLAVASTDKIYFIQCLHKAFDSGAGELVFIEKTSSYKIFYNNQDIFVGGHIKKIAWSPDGQRLAVIFFLNRHSNDSDTMIALYRVKTSPKFTLTPRGFIKKRESSANSIAFVPNYSKGSLLSVSYNDGCISFFPLLYRHKLV